MKGEKHRAGNKVHTMNANNLKDNLVRCKARNDDQYAHLYPTLKNREGPAGAVLSVNTRLHLISPSWFGF